MVAERIRQPVEERPAPAERNAAGRDKQSSDLIEDALRQNSGKPLDPNVRGPMEARLGHDFSRVRIHDDEHANRAARALSAVAFTYGNHVFFEHGAYDVTSLPGRRLLAHELVHVAQTNGTPPPSAKLTVTQPDDALEQEAQYIAEETVSSETIPSEVLKPQIENRLTVARQTVRDRAAEVRDPDRAINSLIWIIIWNLHSDPLDRAGRIRRQFQRLDAQTRATVLDRIQHRLSDAQFTQLRVLYAEEAPSGTEVSTPSAPQTASDESAADTVSEETTPTTEDASTETHAPEAEAQTAAPEAEVEASAATEATTQEAVATPSEETAAEAPASAEAEQTAAAEGEAAQGESAEQPKVEQGEGREQAPASAEAGAAPEGQATAAAPTVDTGGVGGGETADDGALNRTEEVLLRNAGVSRDQAAAQPAVASSAAVSASPSPTAIPSVELSLAQPTAETQGEGVAESVMGSVVDAEPPQATAQEVPAQATETQTEQANTAQAAETQTEPPGTPQAIEQPTEPADAELPPQGSTTPRPAETDDTALPSEDSSPPTASPESSSESVSESESAPAQEPEEEREPSDEELLAREGVTPGGGTAAETAPAVTSVVETQTVEQPIASSAGATSVAAELPDQTDTTEQVEAVTAQPSPVAQAAPIEASVPVNVGAAAPAEIETVDEPQTAEVETPAGDIVAPQGGMVAEEAPVPNETVPQGESAPAEAGAPAQGASCQNPEPVSEQAEGAGAGGGGTCGSGGGGAAAAPSSEPAAPAAAESDPTAAMAQVEGMAPAEAGAALGGVSQAASRSVSTQQQELTAAPPEMERPSGAPPQTARQSPAAPVSPNTSPATAPANRVTPEGGTASEAPPAAAPITAPLPQSQSPRLPGNAELSPNDVQQVRAAVDTLPTTDPALNVSVQTPTLTLDGAANPNQVSQQDTAVAASIDSAHAGAQQDAAQPMGESQVYPVVPQERLRPDAPAGGDQACGSGGDGGGQAAGVAPNDPVAIVAREQGGDQVRAAAGRARGDMTSGQQQRQQAEQTERASKQQEMDAEVAHNAEQQAQQRTSVQNDVRAQRNQWTQEQTTLINGAQTERTQIQRDNTQAVERERTAGNTEASRHVREGNTQIASERRTAETQAGNERQRARSETNSGGFFSWLSSRVAAFFDGIKRAIHAVFEAARRAIQTLLQRFQELAMRAIDAARRAIVSAIQAAGALLIAVGDRLLAAFPTLRDRFRSAIQGLVDAAVAAVNALADALKEGLKLLLNALMAALMAILRALECVYMAAVNVVASAVQSAIQAARSFAQGLGQFIELIGDIADNPGQWLSNLGSSVVSGIRNCLWDAFKLAVKNWFNSKVEEVLGLGLMIYRILTQGCITMAQVGTMAWEGLKAAIPMVLISLLIEKLVSMIIPAAGAILTIIQGLAAAWGTVSRIITAFQLFFAFLRAVKNGNAGGQFATAVAAAAVVVIDFVANWLLQRLMRPARAVGGRLRSIAQRIMQRIGGAARRGARALRRGIGRAVRAVRSGARTAAGAVRRGAQAVVRGVRRAGQAIARGAQAVVRRTGAVGRVVAQGARAVVRTVRRVAGAVVRTVRRTVASIRRRIRSARERFRRWRERRRQRRQQNAQERLRRAIEAIRPPLERHLQHGIGNLRLRGQLFYYQLRYRLRSLRIRPGARIVARVNPEGEVVNAPELTPSQIGAALEPILVAAERRYMEQLQQLAEESPDQGMQAAINLIASRRAAAASSPTPISVDVSNLLHSRSEQIYVMRRVRLMVPPLRNMNIVFGPGAVLDFSTRSFIRPNPTSADYRGFYAQGQGGMRGTSYPALLRAVLGDAERFGIRLDNLMVTIRSSRSSLMGSRLDILRATAARRGMGAAFDEQLAPRIRMIGLLTQGIEPARSEGMMAPTALAYVASDSPTPLLGRGTSEGAEGQLAPLTPVGATGAIERRAGGEELNPSQALAERRRHQRIANIFSRLKDTVKRTDIRAMTGSLQQAAQSLADAFNTWLESHRRNIVTVEQVENLTRTVYIFLQRYHGD
ncbi:MAG: DUF4157 domain-containing protein [Chloroflexi bacterium]|nr:DUF4157 domain-containing protein [Chloroflexota bacterium]